MPINNRTKLFILLSFSGLQAIASESTPFPLPPRLFLEAGVITGAAILGADAMVPILGTPGQRMYHIDLQAAVDTQDAFLIGPGVGVRQRVDEQLWGGYVFGDYTRTDGNAHFWVMNPGIEWISLHWDARINGYFPITHENQSKNLGFASDNGIYQYVTFDGHSEFDQDLIQYDLASNGVDLSAGYTINTPNYRTRLSLGAYYFAAMSDVDAITGAQAGLEVPIGANANVVFAGTYDNVFHGKGLVTFRYALGDAINQNTRDVRDLFRAKIYRNIAAIDTAAGFPTQVSLQGSGDAELVSDDVWFFREGTTTDTSKTFAECTYANPCVGINQSIIDSINTIDPSAEFFISPGNYYAATTATPSTFVLNNGQSIWGRSFNYNSPAQGSNRAILNGAVELHGHNTLDSLHIANDTVERTLGVFGLNVVGVNVLSTSSGDITLNNLNIAQLDNGASTHGVFNLFINGNSDVTLTDSTFSATQNNAITPNGAENIAVVGNNDLKVTSSVLNASDTGTGNSYGIYLSPTAHSNTTVDNTIFNTVDDGTNSGAFSLYVSSHQSHVIFNHSTLNATQLNPNSQFGANGILFTGDGLPHATASIIDVNYTTLNVINVAAPATWGAFGIYMTPDTGNNAQVNVFGSTLNILDQGGYGATGVYVNVGDVSIDHSTVNVTQTGGGSSGAFGVQVFGNANVTIDDTQMAMSDNSANGAVALYMQDGTASINHSQLTMSESSTGLAVAVYLDGGTDTQATLNDSTVDIISTGTGIVTGVGTRNSQGTIQVIETAFYLKATGGNAYGAWVNGGSASVDLTDSFFHQIQSNAQAAGLLNGGTGLITSLNTNYFMIGDSSSTFNAGGAVSQIGGVCSINGVAAFCPG